MFDDGSDCTDKDYGFSIDSICYDDKEHNETPLASATTDAFLKLHLIPIHS